MQGIKVVRKAAGKKHNCLINLKNQKWKPPRENKNHNEVQYDYVNFPWDTILKKAKDKCTAKPPGFETTGDPFKVTLNSATPLTKEISNVFPEQSEGDKKCDSDFWKFFATIRINPGAPLKPILGKLMQYRDNVVMGQDWVYATREEKHFNRDQNVHYFFFSNLNALFLGAFLIGGEGDDLSFPTALSKHCVSFNQMFTYKKGKFDDILVTLHDVDWYKELRKVAEGMMTACESLTCGKLRFDLARLRYETKIEAAKREQVALEVSQWFLNDYYPNMLHSYHEKSVGLKPRGLPKKIWTESYNRKEVLMTNSLANIVKYFRRFDDKKAESENKVLKEINDQEKHGLSKEAKQVKRTTKIKSVNELRRITLDNNFIKTNPKDFKLHPKFSLLLELDETKYGAFNDEKLREWRFMLEEAKQAANILNVKSLYSMEEWSLAQQLFMAGSKCSPEVIKMFYSLKGHHDRQYRKNSSNIVKVAQYAASSRNEHRHQNETVKLELQSLKLSLDLTRKQSGQDPIYNKNEESITKETINKVENQVAARNQMVTDRNGEFPMEDTGKSILEGTVFNKILDKIDTLSLENSIENGKGNHFNASESGYTQEELKEHELDKRGHDQVNFGYTESELKKMEDEDLEPRSKIRKESDCDTTIDSIDMQFEDMPQMSTPVNEKCRNISLQSEPSELRPDSLQEPIFDDSLCKLEVKKAKKPSFKRILPRAINTLKEFNDKMAANAGAKGVTSLPRINISDSELNLLTFNKKDFEEISYRPYFSSNGEVLHTLGHHKWQKRGSKNEDAGPEKFSLKISLSEMKRTWYSLALLYPTGIRAILKAIKTINENRSEDRIDMSTEMECAKLHNELEIFEGGLHDSNWAEHFRRSEDLGKEHCPLPSLKLYNTIHHYLPVIRNKLEMKKPHLRKNPSNDVLKKQMNSIHEARIKLSQGKITITNKDAPGSNNGQETSQWNEEHGQIAADLSECETKRSEYDLFLDGAYDYDRYNEWLEENLIPLTREFYEENPDFLTNNGFQNLSFNVNKDPPKSSTPVKKREPSLSYDPAHIFVPETKKKESEMVKVSMEKNSLYFQAKEILERPLGLKIDENKLVRSWPIREEYVPRFINEKVQFEFGDCILSNPIIPTNADINIKIGDKIIKTKISENNQSRSKPAKLYNLSLSYVNLNPPIQIKLKNLMELSDFSKCAFICISEVRTNSELIEELVVIPLGYKVFTHKRTNNDQCYAFILVKIDLPGKVDVVFDEPPFIFIRWKHRGKSLIIGCIYRPHAKSTIYDKEFSKDTFALNIEKMQKIISKPPAIVCGDFNIDFDKVVLTEDQKVKRLLERCFAKCNKLKTGPTFIRNCNSEGTKIDHLYYKNVELVKSELRHGTNLIGNDGHMIFRVELNVSLNGIIGSTIIKSRPKLDPKVVSKLANSLYDGLKSKLDVAENNVREKYEVESHELFNNKMLISEDDNEYCEVAFEFFERFFSILQPETERKVNIYNYHSKNSNEVTNLNALITELTISQREAPKELKSEYEEAIKGLITQREEQKVKDKKSNMIGKHNANDDDIFALAKALRPKARKVQMTKEIFTADQLAEEYNRVYLGITKHISEAEVTLDILQMCPKINEALKFSFHDYLPCWNRAEIGVKTIEQCFNSLKAKTRGLDSSLYRDGMAMLPREFIEIIDNMILYWTKAGNYPKKFLKGKIKSILKKGNAALIKNRRFISVGNFFQQLLGKITACCVLAYCEYMGFLDDDQYGFRPFRSTDMAVAALLYKVASKSDECLSILLYIDFSSAFFCVKKDLLMDILSTFINKEAMVFFRNSLKPISGTVISDGIESEEIKVPDFGVRQGGGDSPLQFNLCQNWIFKYVSEPMNTRYDSRYLNIQGFADDSILIAVDKDCDEALGLMEKGLKKVVRYVTSVGFSINPSKSEIMIVGKEAKREKFGYIKKVNGKDKRFMKTSQGEIEMNDEPNTLGLRYDNKLTFRPQYNHLMKKVIRLKFDIIELLKIGTRRQLIKNAFAKSTGIYTYGIGVQRVWRKYQYSKAQKEVNDLIRLVYDIKWQNENSWRQNDMLRMVKWPPIRIQHAKAALIKFNKIAQMKSLKFLYDKVDHHLRYPDGAKVLGDFMRRYKFEDDPLNRENVPQIVLNEEDKKHMSRKIKHMFPLSVNFWFKDLPDFIKILIGTHQFDQAVHAYYNRACWHREEEDCSLCKADKVIYKDEESNFQKLVDGYLEDEEMTLEEFNTTFDAEYFENYDETRFDEDDLLDFE